MQLFRVVCDDREPRPRLGQAAGRVAGLTERGAADHEDRVVGGEPFSQGSPVRREGAQVQPVILRKAGAGTERLLEDRGDQALGQPDQGRPGLFVVRACADHDRGRLRVGQEGGDRVDRCGSRLRRPVDRAGRRRRLAFLVGRLVPVVHRNDHERRPAPGRGRVVGALDRAGDVLGSDRLLELHRIVAGEPGELPGEERLVGEVPAILLADEHHQWSAVHPGGGECADRVSEPGGRVQQDERGLPPSDRVPGSHADHRALVQPEHEGEVVGEAREKRDLGRAGVREHRGQAAPAQEVERLVSDAPAQGLRVYHGRSLWS